MMVTVLQVGLIITQFFYFTHSTNKNRNIDEEKWKLQFQQKTTTRSIGNKIPLANKNIICPSALKLFNNTTQLLEMIEKQTRFHRFGGNLASIEAFLNENMQSTLDRLHIRFEPKSHKKKSSGEPLVENAIEYLNEYFKTHNTNRGGYGQPLPGKFSGTNADEGLTGKRWIDVLEDPTNRRFEVSMGPIGPICSNLQYFDKGNYGSEKLFCLPLDYNKNDKVIATTEKSCDIYSIGSNDQWGFEEEVMQQMPECTTHTFDCTLRDNTPLKKPESKNVRFYPFCIGSKLEPPYFPYDQLCEAANTTIPPKLLKMDVRDLSTMFCYQCYRQIQLFGQNRS